MLYGLDIDLPILVQLLIAASFVVAFFQQILVISLQP
jgi:hypothetical protein